MKRKILSIVLGFTIPVIFLGVAEYFEKIQSGSFRAALIVCGIIALNLVILEWVKVIKKKKR